MQINVRIPSGVPSGVVPIRLQVGSASSQTGVTIAVIGNPVVFGEGDCWCLGAFCRHLNNLDHRHSAASRAMTQRVVISWGKLRRLEFFGALADNLITWLSEE
jgi:hypothetical protein